MFNSFARRLSRRIGNVLKFLQPEEIDDSILDREKNLYKRDIIRAGRTIEMFEEDLISPAVLAKAIDKIGCLAYTGGPPANKCAGTYIPKFAELLAKPEVRGELKIAILKSLSTITINHADHQNLCFREGLLRTVGDIIGKSSDGVRLWAVYCLYCMVLDNIRNLQAIKEDNSIHESLREASASACWSGFCHNYADIVLKLAGLEPVKLKKKKETGNSLSPPSKTGSQGERKNKLHIPKSNLTIIDENQEK